MSNYKDSDYENLKISV